MHEPRYYIVFDIERNFRPYQSEAPTEIIDIGAIKIEAGTMSVVETFSSLVKPTASLSQHTTKLTGITKQEVKEADKFPTVIARFRKFVGEEYVLVTWGKEDYGFLTEDCMLHDVEGPDLTKEIRFDLQRFVFNAYEELFPNQPSLKFAVEQLGLEWEGEQHRAFADAQNTANLFFAAAKEKDIHHLYKRKLDHVLVEGGALTDKGKTMMKRWVVKELKKSRCSSLSWGTFMKSETWENLTEQYEFKDTTLLLLQQYFKTAFKKAKQQIRAAAFNKSRAKI
ncbi:inhibitor of KinA sporulation pathway (predicted exonuclease) [Bacillus fengqiuensis]|nr:inhibitor of KinA sporulation pathway (predicted exonuclease) [Bacillus fengqiuensis]